MDDQKEKETNLLSESNKAIEIQNDGYEAKSTEQMQKLSSEVKPSVPVTKSTTRTPMERSKRHKRFLRNQRILSYTALFLSVSGGIITLIVLALTDRL